MGQSIERDLRSLDGDWILECREFARATATQKVSTRQEVSKDRLKLETTPDGVTGVLTSRAQRGVRRWRVDGHLLDPFLSLSYQTQGSDRVGVGTYVFERMNTGVFKGYWTGRDAARPHFVQGPCLLYRNAREKFRYAAHLAENCHELGIALSRAAKSRSTRAAR